MLKTLEDLKIYLQNIWNSDLSFEENFDVLKKELNKYDLTDQEQEYLIPFELSHESQSHSESQKLDEEIKKRLLKLKKDS